MKTAFVAVAVVAASAFAAPAIAGSEWGKVVACYDKVWVAPTYSVTKKLIRAAEVKYVWKNGQLKKLHYPAVYEEIKTLASDGYYLAQSATCK